MNKLLKILTPLLGLTFLVFLALNIKNMMSDPFVSDEKSLQEIRSNHFAFFLPEADYSFFKDLKNGAISAAQAMDCSISFHPIDTDPLSLEMARYSGIDGVAVYLYQKDERLISSLMKISESGIPIVQIENQVLNNPQSFFIGTNIFDFGKGIGRLALQSDIKNLNIALVYSDKNPGLMADGSLLEMGIKSILGKRVSILYSARTSLNPLDAEKLTDELVHRDENFNLIVLTDTNDTLVSTQAIIDMNLVGLIQVIGFGNDAVIKDYINKGVILGSIVRDPYDIGYSAVLALTEIKNSGYTSAYVDTGITIIDKKNSNLPVFGGAK